MADKVETKVMWEGATHDAEKANGLTTTPLAEGESTYGGSLKAIPRPTNILQRWANRLEELVGIEARGVERVPESARPTQMRAIDYIQMMLVWFSADLTANNLLIGLLGPTAYSVGFTDSMLLGFFGTMIGSAGAAYMSTFGARSGCRTLVVARYTMGWWPSRICVAFNVVIMLGYGLVDTLIAGQILSAVNGAGLSVIVGTIIAALICLGIVVFGIRVYHTYERYAFIPQILVLCILIGVAGQYCDLSFTTQGTSAVRIGNRVSFFFLCVSAPLTWAPAAADFFVYFSPSAKRWSVFLCTLAGIGFGSAIVVLIGAALGSGVPGNPRLSSAYDSGIGALLIEYFTPLGGFGKFCCVILALGVIANNVPGTYSAALSLSLLGRWCTAIPRVFWAIFGTIVYTVCACVGRNKLYNIFEDFLALMGYWTAIWVGLTLEEEFIFRRRKAVPYDWEAWNIRGMLPLGAAAFVCFCIGWAGAAVGMNQVYFIGPVARQVGDGIDLGIPMGMGLACLFYPGLRHLELKYLGR